MKAHIKSVKNLDCLQNEKENFFGDLLPQIFSMKLQLELTYVSRRKHINRKKNLGTSTSGFREKNKKFSWVWQISPSHQTCCYFFNKSPQIQTYLVQIPFIKPWTSSNLSIFKEDDEEINKIAKLMNSGIFVQNYLFVQVNNFPYSQNCVNNLFYWLKKKFHSI